MVEPFVAEIRTVGFNYAPEGWALCNGQILPISQNTALFSLLGTTYGGNGESTFGLPNLNGSFLIGQGQGPGLTNRDLGEVGGASAVTLTVNEMPAHTHPVLASSTLGTSGDPVGKFPAQSRLGRVPRPGYGTGSDVTMAPNALAPVGQNAPHENMPPFLGMYYIIALVGVFPQRP